MSVHVVLPVAPVHEVDFVGTFIEMFEGKYTTMGSRSTLHPRVVKAQLNQYLADVMPDVQDERHLLRTFFLHTRQVGCRIFSGELLESFLSPLPTCS